MKIHLLCFFVLILPVMGDDEKIPVITSVSGETYNDVRVMERNGDSVKIMYRDGIKTLKYSDLDQKSAKLLGFDEYKKELAEQLENEQKQSNSTQLIVRS